MLSCAHADVAMESMKPENTVINQPLLILNLLEESRCRNSLRLRHWYSWDGVRRVSVALPLFSAGTRHHGPAAPRPTVTDACFSSARATEPSSPTIRQL